MSKKLTLSLTAPESHTVDIPVGQGSFAIGILGMDKKKYDALVDNKLPLQWQAFDTHYTGAGSHWPRFFYYYGDDTGFIPWSAHRPIEDFHWHPNATINIDLEDAQINRLFIQSESGGLITLGQGIQNLHLSGKLENIQIDAPTLADYFSLHLSPILSGNSKEPPYQLPQLDSLKHIQSLEISGKPSRQAFDCESLLQFSHLTSLNLWGRSINLNALSQLEKLEHIGLRYMPDLVNFPSLKSWSNLNSFIGWNVEETQGKKLRTELNAINKEQALKFSNISLLRKKAWFLLEAELPFSGWSNTKNAKAATKAFKSAAQHILKAKSNNDVKTIIQTFTQAINPLPQIETTEREDVGSAVIKLAQAAPEHLNITKENALYWFDEMREF